MSEALDKLQEYVEGNSVHGRQHALEWVAALRAELLQLRQDARRIGALEQALERIVGMCDVGRDQCLCGRPTGIGAVVACAKRALKS